VNLLPLSLHCPQLPEHAASPALAHLGKRAPDFLARSPAARQTQKFPLAASRRIALSSSASVSSRFSSAVLTSSALSLLASCNFMPPYWFCQRWKVCSLTPRSYSTCANERTDGSMASDS
jgi:hypothetical protein